ncbi:MAG: hypothetical protein F9K28_07675 [Bacteroidetes bacterium]|nr:MAG: hypothetical protein F9K28_07675 [Bacteroidota bacterium]
MDTQQRQGYIQAGRALEIIIEWANKSKAIIRIITGYFTVKGYNTVRQHFKDKKLILVVGVEDPGLLDARKALVQEIMRELRTGLDDGRHYAVEEIMRKIVNKELQIFDARALDHHAKVYIFDNKAVLVASSNFTFKGLHDREESGLPTTEPIEVDGFIKDFENLYDRAYDITSELLEQLEQWLQLRSPWEVYLKTLLCMEGYEKLPAVSKSYRFPVSYQKYLVTRAVNSIQEYGGHMIVAQTGLGKTVIGTEVARVLHLAREISHVLVIGPGPVEGEWKSHMLSAGIPCEYLIQQNLHFADPSRSAPLENFLRLVDYHMNDHWLIIIDESHIFRNRYTEVYKDGELTHKEKLAFQRLKDAREKTNAKILLLTGTPYSKEIDDINYQLALLPPTTPANQLAGFEDMLKKRSARSWRIRQPEELKELDEVVTVLTTPVVVKNWAKHDEAGNPYIVFGMEKRFFPKIALKRVNTVVWLAEMIVPLLNSDILRLSGNYIYDPKTGEISNAHIIWSQRAGVTKAWASSPWALVSRLSTIIDPIEEEKGYKYSLDDRAIAIEPILAKLSGLQFDEDHKLMSLLALLDNLVEQRRKVIIFCLYRPTISYLETAIKKYRPEWNIFGTVYSSSQNYSSKPTEKVKQAIYRFAPESNNRSRENIRNLIDIFISTDKFAVGVNMQDADVVINYDLPWDAVAPYQRAGRILRPWHTPRVIDIYIFVPQLSADIPDTFEFTGLEKHWQKLVMRHQTSSQILDLPVITTEHERTIDMYQLGTVIEMGEIVYERLSDTEIETSSIISKHMSRLEHNRAEAEMISDDIVSAMENPNLRVKVVYIYVLLKHSGRYFTVVYNTHTDSLVNLSEMSLLDMIECHPETPALLIRRDEIDQLGNRCLELWCLKKAVNPEEVVRVCTLYLRPSASI